MSKFEQVQGDLEKTSYKRRAKTAGRRRERSDKEAEPAPFPASQSHASQGSAVVVSSLPAVVPSLAPGASVSPAVVVPSAAVVVPSAAVVVPSAAVVVPCAAVVVSCAAVVVSAQHTAWHDSSRTLSINEAA